MDNICYLVYNYSFRRGTPQAFAVDATHHTMDKETVAKNSVKRHLGKHVVKHYTEILMNLIMVNICVKQGFLFDFSTVRTDEFMAFLDDLKTHDIIDTTDLAVLSIDVDIIIINRVGFMNDFNTSIRHIFIDVSNSLAMPHLLDKKTVLKSIYEVINDIKVKLETNIHEKCINIHLPKEINACSLFGILLGYPTVYWFDNQISFDNCLSFEPLILNTIFVKRDPKKLIMQTCDDDLKSLFDCEHKIIAFSYPAIFSDKLNTSVNEWFVKWSDVCNNTGFTARLDKTSVTLPAVTM